MDLTAHQQRVVGWDAEAVLVHCSAQIAAELAEADIRHPLRHGRLHVTQHPAALGVIEGSNVV